MLKLIISFERRTLPLRNRLIDERDWDRLFCVTEICTLIWRGANTGLVVGDDFETAELIDDDAEAFSHVVDRFRANFLGRHGFDPLPPWPDAP